MSFKVNQKERSEVIKKASCIELTTRFLLKRTMQNLLLLFFVVCHLGLISCTQQINCPKYDKKILTWVPYQANDVIELYSQARDSTIIFLINDVTVEHTTDFTLAKDCNSCTDYSYVNNDESESNFRVYINSNRNEVSSQHYWVCGSCFYTYTEFKNYTFENKKYDVVRIFDNEEQCSHGMLKTLILAKDIGVIGLIDNKDNIWTLKTNVNENRKDRDVVIINRSCR